MKTSTETMARSPVQPESHIFDLWAQVYDAQSNPLLMLEERCVTPLLPPLSGEDVLDVGCGTGRWLRRLEVLEPGSLIGIDCSTIMLERARSKVRPTTTLELSQCSVLPGEDGSRGIVLASFVLSYLDDLEQFARECRRILRPDGWLLISDMHPLTAAERGWTRSFHLDGEKIQIAAHSRSIDEIIAVFRRHGFDPRVLNEPSFETCEGSVFESAGKLAKYEELSGVPAIYILKLQKRMPSLSGQAPRASSTLQLANAPIALSPVAWRDGAVLIEDGHIVSLHEAVDESAPKLDLAGYFLLPGLINAHEHLEFGLFPKLGRPAVGPPYRNATEWAKEIHRVHSSIIAQYRQIPQATHLRWGAIRNLLCGITTVCHHNPLHTELTRPDFPVRVLHHFGWSHSLAFDQQLAQKFQATPQDRPFILHAAEGLDEESRNEISQLNAMHVLDERAVLVHGLACTTEEIALINRRGASVVVCPTSNRFLFAETLSCELLTSIERVALGSDSPITAAGDLLDEVRSLHAEIGLDPNLIYSMITTGPAEMFHLKDGQGRIVESGVADLIAVRVQHGSPARTLSNLAFSDVELVLLEGRVQMASPPLFARLPYDLRSGMELIEVAGHQRWIRSSLQDLFEAAESVLHPEKLLLAGREVRYLGTL
ncbi:methyltransferase domain-containing protein [Edaphobacter modestus]|nr:methyltransferase domain-containing protein [Edaphobacter modestus]